MLFCGVKGQGYEIFAMWALTSSNIKRRLLELSAFIRKKRHFVRKFTAEPTFFANVTIGKDVS